MRRRAIPLTLAALFLSAAWNPAALADGTRFRDGDDAAGPLDVVRIAHGHRTTAAGAHRLVHTIELDEAWPVKKLGTHGFLLIYFELPGHPANPPERTLQIDYGKKQQKLVAHMYDSLGDPHEHLGRVRLQRPDWRTLRVVFPKSLLRKGRLARYKWNAVSFVERGYGGCKRRGGCTDWAPDARDGLRYVKHHL